MSKATEAAKTGAEAFRLDKTHPLNDGPTRTGDGRIVGPFLEAVANDVRHGTYHAACAEEFETMTVAVRDYFNKLVEVEGADMPGLYDLDEAMEYAANGRVSHFDAAAYKTEANVVPLRPVE
jgi:hypothetical protein